MPPSSVQVRKRLPPSERRQLILDAAYQVFARLGYDAVSMDQIAAEVGVTKPILYRHFSSKSALVSECGRRMAGLMLNAVRAATDPGLPPDGQLWAGIVAQLRFIAEHRGEWSVYVLEAPLR